MEDAILPTSLVPLWWCFCDVWRFSRFLTRYDPSFLDKGGFEQMAATGAADASSAHAIEPGSCGNYGSPKPLNTNCQAFMPVKFCKDSKLLASQAVQIHIIVSLIIACSLRSGWLEASVIAPLRLDQKDASSANINFIISATTATAAMLPRCGIRSRLPPHLCRR